RWADLALCGIALACVKVFKRNVLVAMRDPAVDDPLPIEYIELSAGFLQQFLLYFQARYLSGRAAGNAYDPFVTALLSDNSRHVRPDFR
ncbi:hypothetical protein ACC795_36455, partial [Rhizobium ruizarguesonis]